MHASMLDSAKKSCMLFKCKYLFVNPYDRNNCTILEGRPIWKHRQSLSVMEILSFSKFPKDRSRGLTWVKSYRWGVRCMSFLLDASISPFSDDFMAWFHRLRCEGREEGRKEGRREGRPRPLEVFCLAFEWRGKKRFHHARRPFHGRGKVENLLT